MSEAMSGQTGKYGPGFYLKGISPVKPEKTARAVAWVLDVWSASVHHQAGLGSADPEWMWIFGEPQAPPPLGDVHRFCEDSNKMYDATPKKYERHPRSDVRVLFCADAVERALAGFPPELRLYVLYRYPRRGCYQPQLLGRSWSERPAEAFLERALDLRVFKGEWRQVEPTAERIERMFRRFKKKLAQTLDMLEPSATMRAS